MLRVRIPGRFAHEGTDVAVGDWIALADGSVDSVLPRRSAIVRNAAGRATRVQTLVGERRRRLRRHLARPRARAAPHRALPRDDLGERRDARRSC